MEKKSENKNIESSLKMMKLDIRNKYAEENNLEGKDVIMEIIIVGGAKTTLQTKMYCIGLIDKEGKKEDILDISSDITHIKLDKVIHNFIDLKVRLDQVERPTGKIDIFNVYHRKTFVHLSHVYICMYYFNMIL